MSRQKRSPFETQSSQADPGVNVLPPLVKQYWALEVAWQMLHESQQPEHVVGQLLLGASHSPETHV